MKLAVKSVAVVAISLGAVAGMTACSSSSTTENLPTPSISIPTGAPTDGGNPDISGGKSLPANWPSDVPTPTGLPVQGGGGYNGNLTAAFLGPADVKAVQAQLNSDFKKNGFTSSTSFGGGDTGGVTLWTKGNQKVQVTVAQQDGKVAVSETIIVTQQ